ncbi:MAG: hypothetical protein OSA99_09115 [Acidimicrobiales bacterium]|nr:hypothetical protein [Acidimicrobiales bacterium]
MLVLVSFGLVLLATILLVVGLLNDDGLTLIYLSIAASATAAVVLYVAFRMARPKKDPDAASAPAPLSEDIAPTPIDDTTAVAAVVSPDAPPVAEPEPEAEPVAVATAAPSDDEWMADADWEEDEVVDFPIADYDALTVGEIMPLLPQLYSDELDDVIERESAGKNRSTILSRLEELKEIGTDADAAEQAAASEVETTPAPAPVPAAPVTEAAEDDDADDDGFFFPIADYDNLSVSQITPLLSQLEADELDEVRERELAGAGRKTILTEIDRLADGSSPEAPTPAPATRTKTAAKKTPAKKKAAAKKAPAKKATKAKATKKKATKKARKTTKKSAAPRFPIADYDELTVADIRPRLTDLSDRQLRQVRERELAGAGRKTVLKDIDNRLG